MSLLFELEDNEYNQVQSRFNELFGKLQTTDGEKSYFEVFNNDVKVINNLLCDTSQEMHFYQKAYVLQEEYNEALMLAKERWSLGNKGFHNGASIIKDLSARKRAYDSSMQTLKTFDEKLKLLNSFTQKNNGNDEISKSPTWLRLKAKAQELDSRDNENDEIKHTFQINGKTRLARLDHLAQIWQSQGVLSKGNVGDILKFMKELDNIEGFLDFICNKISKSTNPVDIGIQEQITHNRQQLTIYRENSIAALGWRIVAAICAGNLQCDDSLLGLMSELKTNVFHGASDEELEDIKDLLVIPDEVKTFDMKFDEFSKALNILKHANQPYWYQRWLNSRWVTNTYKGNLIEVVVKDNNVIPNSVAKVIPAKPSFTPDSWVRYWFFRTSEKLGIFATWLRNKLVGTYDESLIYINETYRQLIHFETMLSKHKSAGFSLNLNNICSSAAFVYALGLPKVIQDELRRGEAVRPSWTIGVLLSKIPFFNRFATYQLFSDWEKELNNSRKVISLKYRKIAKFILDDFEKLMLNSIQAKTFNFQEGLINSLEKFMELYGEKSDIEKFKIISDPITILQKFDFLMPANESNDFFVINDDAIITFKNFAHKYWPSQQQKAIEAILNIINKSDIPANEADDAKLKKEIDCLLKGDDKDKAFKELMNTIAIKFLFKAGDDGNNDVYAFLQRHAKEAAANFRAKRQLDIEDKFIFINKILSDGINKEIDLSKQEIYEVQNLKLRYSLYGLYINDIMEDDKVNQANKMALLFRATQRYIRSYKGDNCEYADLILSLCMPQKMSLVNDFVKKRLTYILDEQTKDNALVVLEDYQFLSKLSKDPSIVDTMVQVIDSHFDGSNIDDIELMLAFNHDKVTAKYIANRIQYFINKHDYDSLNEELSLYQDHIDNQFLQEYIQKLLLDHYDSLILNRKWDDLESTKLSCFVENIGTIQSKETYRLLRINRLLKRNDSEATKDYLSEVASFIGSLEKNLITLPRAKALLEKILSEQLMMLQEEHRWEGHTQYFLDFFLSSDPKGMLFDIKMAWLRDYFANPEKFANANSLERSFLEAKYHCQNKEVPSEDVDLESFYSKANLRTVKKIIMDILDNIDSLQDDEHLNLMRRYLKDKAFTLDPQWPLYIKKIEIYQNVVKIAHLTSKGAYTQVMKYIEHLISENKGLKALNSSMPDPQRTALIAYNKRMLALLGTHIKIHFQNKIVSKEILEKLNSREFQKYAKLTHQERKLISQLVNQSGLSNSIKTTVDELDQNAQHIFDVTTGFVCALHFKSLHLIEPSEDNVRLFRQYLSLDTKKYITQRIEVICGFLTEDDPLYQALCAFVRVLNFDENANLLDVIDLSILNRYRVSQRNYPQMANEVALKIIQILNERKPLSQCSVFNELKGSYQSAFINEMSPKSMALLTRSLKAKIEWIVITQDTVSNEHRQDWLNHARLHEWLSTIDSPDVANLKMSMNQWTKCSLEEAKKSLQTLIDKFDNVILNKNNSFEALLNAPAYFPTTQIRQVESQLTKAALFIRCFGDDLQKKSLDKLLSEVARRQRKAMMVANQNAFTEYCLEYADRVLNLAGNDQQRLESSQLHDLWNRYRMANTGTVRDVALKDAIPQYIEDFDSIIFQYFIHKHNLDVNFTQVMLDKIQLWQLQDELVEPNALLKAHPISEFQQILVEASRNQKHGFFYSGPSVGDAQKLFVAFCLTLQAHQLARIWQQHQENTQQALRSFKPDDISQPLNMLVNRLSKQFNIGSNRFNKSISNAINKDRDNFASWSVIEMSANERDELSKVASLK